MSTLGDGCNICEHCINCPFTDDCHASGNTGHDFKVSRLAIKKIGTIKKIHSMRKEPLKETCKHCGSQTVVRYGSYKGNPRYYCKNCKRKFIPNNNLPNMRYPREMVDEYKYYRRIHQPYTLDQIRRIFIRKYGRCPVDSVLLEWERKFNIVVGGVINHERKPSIMLEVLAYEHNGKIYSTDKILELFSYAPSTKIKDTQLFKREYLTSCGSGKWLIKFEGGCRRWKLLN